MAAVQRQHPRDAFLLHQEYLQRLNEGDEMDVTAFTKVSLELERLHEMGSTVTASFFHEDHTLGNPLRHVLMQQANTLTAGYAIPHPLEPRMVVHVQSTEYAVDAIANGLERLAALCEETVTSFEAARRQQSRSGKQQ